MPHTITPANPFKPARSHLSCVHPFSGFSSTISLYPKILTLLLLASAPLKAEPSFTEIPGKRKNLQSPAIKEASGLACSPTDPSFLWVINDSGNTNKIHLINTDGTSRGSVSVKNVRNRDWEDLSSFSINGKPHLLIANTGDNAARQTTYTLHIVREPELPAHGRIIAGEVPLAWQVTFSLPGNTSADIEAVAVDQKAGEILFVTKRQKPAILYSVPLAPRKKPSIAKKICEVVIKAPALSLVPFRNQPSGMDISKDSSTAAIITYYGIFLFHRDDSQTWAEAFSKRPESLGAHHLPQAESVAFSPSGKNIYAISEGANTPIVIWQSAN